MPRTKYIWDDENILMEKDEFGTTTKSYTLEPQIYGNLVSEYDGTDTLHHHYDALGSTRQLTDQNGDLTDDYVYDAWGNLIAHTGTSHTAFLWIGEVGYYWDAETGLYDVRARLYLAPIARWNTVDPLRMNGGWNFYRYAHNRPTTSVDPSGAVTLADARESLCRRTPKMAMIIHCLALTSDQEVFDEWLEMEPPHQNLWVALGARWAVSSANSGIFRLKRCSRIRVRDPESGGSVCV